MRPAQRFILLGVVVASEAVAFLGIGEAFPGWAVYPLPLILIAVFIIAFYTLRVLSKPARAEAAGRPDPGVPGRRLGWTKDSLAAAVTSIFLAWVVVGYVVPFWYFPARSLLYGPNGENLLASDIILGICGFFFYQLVGSHLSVSSVDHSA